MSEKPREIGFDALKGLAIIAVVAIHATETGWPWLSKDSGQWNYYFTLIIKQSYAFAVPAFFFVAGYFSAKKGSVSNRLFLTRRLSNILVPYLLWSTLALLFFFSQELWPEGALKKLLLGQAMGPYYFIVTLACFTLLTPLLRELQNHSLGLLTIIAVNLLSLIVIYYFRITSDSGLYWYYSAAPFSSWIIFYYLGMESSKRGLVTLFPGADTYRKGLILMFFFLILSCLEAFALRYFFGEYSGAANSVKFSSFLYSLSLLSLFLILRREKYCFSARLAKLGKYSFGIYLMHEFFRGKLGDGIAYALNISDIQLLHQWLTVILTISICMIIILTVRRLIGESASARFLGF